jgi:hypothetical protein
MCFRNHFLQTGKCASGIIFSRLGNVLQELFFADWEIFSGIICSGSGVPLSFGVCSESDPTVYEYSAITIVS